MIETKIKEVENKEKFPALYCSEKRETVLLVKRVVSHNKLEGIILHPKTNFGEYSMSWSASKYTRMTSGSELTFKFIQE
jgi:hypothetical protein